MYKRQVLLCIVALIIFLCVKNASRNDKQSQENSNFKIVTSFYPIYIMTLNVTEGANNIELKNMAELNGGCCLLYTSYFRYFIELFFRFHYIVFSYF